MSTFLYQAALIDDPTIPHVLFFGVLFMIIAGPVNKETRPYVDYYMISKTCSGLGGWYLICTCTVRQFDKKSQDMGSTREFLKISVYISYGIRPISYYL